MSRKKPCAAPSTTQEPPSIGHNNPPRTDLFGLGAPWLWFADQLDLARLATLHVRIARKEQSLRDMRKERSLIMNRCIRRMRRAEGKN